MTLEEAQGIIREVHGRSYSWLLSWGLSLIRAAIRTIFNRETATAGDLELAEDVKRKLYRKW